MGCPGLKSSYLEKALLFQCYLVYFFMITENTKITSRKQNIWQRVKKSKKNKKQIDKARRR